jgi:predicted nucleotidyltransferase
MDKYANIRKKALPLLKPYISRMAVFGSTVRGEATENSDLDLLIKLKPLLKKKRSSFMKRDDTVKKIL